MIRRSLVNGLKGHIRKAERCRKEGKPFHRTAASSAKDRRTKKLTQKQSWFKNKPRDLEKSMDDGPDRDGRLGTGKMFKEGDRQVAINDIPIQDDKNQPSTVLFVEYSKGATLQ